MYTYTYYLILIVTLFSLIWSIYSYYTILFADLRLYKTILYLIQQIYYYIEYMIISNTYILPSSAPASSSFNFNFRAELELISN